MKKPSKPHTPPKPSSPKEFWPVEHSAATAIMGHKGTLSLEQLLSKLPHTIKPEELKFNVLYTNSDGEYDYDGAYRFEITYDVITKDPDYADACKRHKKALIKHEKKMASHAIAMSKYEAEMKVYVAWEKTEKVRQEAEELKRLKKRIQELEKKK